MKRLFTGQIKILQVVSHDRNMQRISNLHFQLQLLAYVKVSVVNVLI